MVLYRTIGWFHIELSGCTMRTVGRRHGDGVRRRMFTVAKMVDTGEVIAICLLIPNSRKKCQNAIIFTLH